jgi:hypothetical protein
MRPNAIVTGVMLAAMALGAAAPAQAGAAGGTNDEGTAQAADANRLMLGFNYGF